MPAFKPQRRNVSEEDVRAAQNYLDSISSSEDDVSAEEIEAIRESVEAIRQGEMTLAEFERKHDL